MRYDFFDDHGKELCYIADKKMHIAAVYDTKNKQRTGQESITGFRIVTEKHKEAVAVDQGETIYRSGNEVTSKALPEGKSWIGLEARTLDELNKKI